MLNEHWHKVELSELLLIAGVTHNAGENMLIYLTLRLPTYEVGNNIFAEFP